MEDVALSLVEVVAVGEADDSEETEGAIMASQELCGILGEADGDFVGESVGDVVGE